LTKVLLRIDIKYHFVLGAAMRGGGKRGQAVWYDGFWPSSNPAFHWKPETALQGRLPGLNENFESTAIANALTGIGPLSDQAGFRLPGEGLYGHDDGLLRGAILPSAEPGSDGASANAASNRPSVTVMGVSRSPGGAPVRPFSQVFVSDGYEAQDQSNLQLTIIALFGANIDIRNPPPGVRATMTTNTSGDPRYHLFGTETALNAYLDTLVLDLPDSTTSTTYLFSFEISDADPTPIPGTGPDNGILRVHRVPTNNAPNVSGENAVVPYFGITVKPFGGIAVSDGDTAWGDEQVVLTIYFHETWGTINAVETTGVTTGLGRSSDGYLHYSFTGTEAALNAYLDNLEFTLVTPFGASLAFYVRDSGNQTSITGNVTVLVTPAANPCPPSVDASGTTTSAGGAPVAPFGKVDVSDGDTDNREPVTLTISFAEGKGTISTSNLPVGVTATGPHVNGGTRSYTFTGTEGALNTFLNTLMFDPMDAAGRTTFSFSVTDVGHTTPTLGTGTVTVETTNAAPSVAASGTAISAEGVAVKPFGGVVVSDGDAPALELVSLTVSFEEGKGTISTSNLPAGVTATGPHVDGTVRSYTFRGTESALNAFLDDLTFDPTDVAGTTIFSFAVTDVGHTTPTPGVGDVTVTTTISPVNRPPIIDVPDEQAVTQTTNRAAPVSPFAIVTVADPDTNDTLTLKITFDTDKGHLEGTDVEGEENSGRIQYTFVRTASQLNTILDSLTFRPTPPAGAAEGTIIETLFVITLTDENEMVENDEVIVATMITPPDRNNQAPAVDVADDKAVTYAMDTGPAVFALRGVTFADDENDDLTVEISFKDADGVLQSVSDTSILREDGTRVHMFTGKAAAINAALQKATFDPTNRFDPGAPVMTQFTIKVKDVDHDFVSNHEVRVVTTIEDKTPVNNAPTDISLSTRSVYELSRNGTLVGVLGTADTAGDEHAYSIVDGDGRFKIVGNQLQVANGLKLDTEQMPVHLVRIRTTDKGGKTFEKAFNVSILDVKREKTSGSKDNDYFRTGQGSDNLAGGAGNDTLDGGAGHDVMTGGKGKDFFVFRAPLKKNVDKIDFYAKDDTIYLDDLVFKKLGKASFNKPVKLNKKFFLLGEAKDKDDYIGYKDKKFLYDPDGNGALAPIVFATTNKSGTVTEKDFMII
jgi:Ca2+-binding RTX toxin-like protein